ncbi:hypothetical protein CC78DRAFT_608165 [Lojkania enalia]|uniref:C2H2-type domain-containing protein n=1 Tax=Lojkania enalia TaxID=147567 RepID=A0A9P4K526_9PLEO|nr:hypothetical protein CC78DRAFT_608165 [Didymosphaeria enalia]
MLDVSLIMGRNSSHKELQHAVQRSNIEGKFGSVYSLGKSEGIGSSSDLVTTLSGETYHGNVIGLANHTRVTHNALPIRMRERFLNDHEPAVFETLKSQDEDLELSLDGITTWVSDLHLTNGETRLQQLAEVLTNVDNALAGGREEAKEQHTSSTHQSRRTSKELMRSGQASRTTALKVRKIQKRSKASQRTSGRSESINEPTEPPDGGSIEQRLRLFSCPFVKQNPDRYVFVGNSCTERFGFPTPGKLVEHLKRVHSLRVPCCITCKLRFHRNRVRDAERCRTEHLNLGQCEPRNLRIDEPEWMTEEQDARFARSIIQGQPTSAEDKWRIIYRQLFNLPEDSMVPDPYYDFLMPRHLVADTGFSMQFTSPRPSSTMINTSIHSMQPPPSRFDAQDNAFLSRISLDTPLEAMLVHDWESQYSPNGSTHNTVTIGSSSRLGLTSESLDMNDRSQPEIDFQYGVYTGEDSGYRSLGQGSAVDTEMPSAGRQRSRSAESSLMPKPSGDTIVVRPQDLHLYSDLASL